MLTIQQYTTMSFTHFLELFMPHNIHCQLDWSPWWQDLYKLVGESQLSTNTIQSTFNVTK